MPRSMTTGLRILILNLGPRSWRSIPRDVGVKTVRHARELDLIEFLDSNPDNKRCRLTEKGLVLKRRLLASERIRIHRAVEVSRIPQRVDEEHRG
ncbi:hypothetical protein FHT76_008237 [Rhizobium sp. BK176]|nr:hypothetical protein [Rhizobium sp. BK181]MBB3543171.1 hypothetical protein [Rhizobium sp. BK399]MCS3744216.1 hypothetical protein [Rhizobium sp. BK661]MCS4096515.1 hypothetical protein [Rhizobium sp. BK176]